MTKLIRMEKKIGLMILNKKNTIMKNLKAFERFINENKEDWPPYMGTNYNEIHVLYKLDDDNFSWVPASAKYWAINTDNTLINKITGYFGTNDEHRYKRELENKQFFFIYSDGKRYVYLPKYKSLWDKHQNRMKSKEQNPDTVKKISNIIMNTMQLPDFTSGYAHLM